MTDEWSNRGASLLTNNFNNAPDWSENAISRDHLWRPTSSADDCYAEDSECTVTKQFFEIIFKWIHIAHLNYILNSTKQGRGQRFKCSACKIVAHSDCISNIKKNSQLACKPTFREQQDQNITHHHWVHRRSQKGNCKMCGKVISK